MTPQMKKVGWQFITSSSEDVSKYENKIINYTVKHRLIKLHKNENIYRFKNQKHNTLGKDQAKG